MEGMCPAWQFPDGVKFIYASYAGFASAGFFGPYYSLMNVFYNGADGKTRWGIYAVNNNDGLLAKVSWGLGRGVSGYGRWMKIL